MSHHWDYANKTRAERRERKHEKHKRRQGQGKSVKLMNRLAMKRAGVPERPTARP